MTNKQLTRNKKQAQPKGHVQQILMDWQGFILESNDTIFSTLKLHHQPATEWSDFFLSIFPVLHELELSSDELYFPRIASIANHLTGIYDCSFMRVELSGNDHIIVWNIFDNTEYYRLIQQRQQKYYDILLRGI